MTRLLVSVRDVPEALLAASGGADFIDLKEPREGALGGLAVHTITAIVASLRARGVTLPISATIGDLGMDQLDAILARVHAVAACRVDYVKVGITRAPQAAAVLAALAASGHAIVPVFIADRGLDFERVQQAGELGFPGVMVDTADKLAGNETVKQALMAGMGISFLSAHAVQVELAAGRIAVLDVVDMPKWL
ncbi:MAG TPA: (5-formylfuran-3-yl)methyl phosphate synthase, partial [Ideonella sp.]|nr:(5-formylfuran-3-yl)methyl phosphate synthase [Ideonella sp.]